MAYIHRDSKSLFFEIHGKGEPLLLLQGNTASSVSFHFTGDVDYFSKNHCVVTMDFYGTGNSSRIQEWPLDWYKQAARDAYEVLVYNEVSSVKVIGSSGGALIGFWLAILYPEIVKNLVADSFGLDYANQMPEVMRHTRKTYSADQIAFWQHNHGEDWQQVVEADTDFILRYAAAQTGPQVDIPLELVQCPVLITGSKEDDMIPNIVDQAEQAPQRLKQAQLYMDSQGKHPYMWSQSQAFREQVEKFWI